jgi:glucose/arabinose dehydrogenase
LLSNPQQDVVVIFQKSFPITFLFYCAVMLQGCSSDSTGSVVAPAPGALNLKLETIATGLSSPLYITSPAADTRLFVVEQGGQIKIIQDGATLAAPFLDVSAKIFSGGERGLLSLAFHPQYASNRQFYIYYTDPNGDITVERYRAAANNPNQADAASGTLVIRIPHRDYPNHNGGQLAFGSDGYLYISTGDGGGGGDPLGSGQSFTSLLGKLLRLDVSAEPYRIPQTNPYAGLAARREEIWAYGLRNPWRFSFDSADSKLYIGDVGQVEREEINVADVNEAGLNYGWNTTEGLSCYSGAICDKTGITLPAIDHAHPGAVSITGGYVYRGSKIPDITGTYFYGDFGVGWVKSFVYRNGAATEQKDWPSLKVPNLASFGVDSVGELYVVSLAGTVYRIVQQ